MTLYNKKESFLLCNGCGRKIPILLGDRQEDFLSVDKTWGYFSKRDGIRMRFHLCEDCVNRMIRDFAIAPEQTEETELFPPVFPEE